MLEAYQRYDLYVKIYEVEHLFIIRVLLLKIGGDLWVGFVTRYKIIEKLLLNILLIIFLFLSSNQFLDLNFFLILYCIFYFSRHFIYTHYITRAYIFKDAMCALFSHSSAIETQRNVMFPIGKNVELCCSRQNNWAVYFESDLTPFFNFLTCTNSCYISVKHFRLLIFRANTINFSHISFRR